MNNRSVKFVVAVLLFLPLGNCLATVEPNIPETDEKIVAVITCHDMIDNGLYESIQRRTDIALDAGAEYIIYDIDTYGGDLYAADNISAYFLHEAKEKAHTVAYVSKKAISAGAMISVACEDIIMKKISTIGDCAPIIMGGKLEGVEREKIETFTRAAFVASAKANGYPEPVLRAMVTMQIGVYQVKNLKTDEFEFFEADQLPNDPNEYDIEHKKLIVSEKQILTLTAPEALEYGVSRASVENRAGAIDFIEKRDGVIFSDNVMVLEPNWSEQLVRWIQSPIVMSILVMVAMLGIYIELNTPGVGLPGLVAVICFTIIIGSKYLVGLANWLEIALFVVGLILLAVEIFVLPGFGIAGVLGIICIFAGLFGMLIKNPPDKLPWPQNPMDWDIFTQGVIGLSAGFVGFVILAGVLAKYLPRLEFLSGLILVPTGSKQPFKMQLSISAPAESVTARLNIGDIGEVTSTLRPAGKARFGDCLVDCITEAEFLDKGTAVRIIAIRGNKAVVKKVSEEIE